MEDTRRVLIAFLLVFVMLFLWTTLTGKKKAAQQVQVQTQTQTQQPLAAQPAPAVQPVAPAVAKAVAPERFDTLENGKLRIVFSSLGGTITSVWLKEYKAELIPAGSHIFGLGLPTLRDYADLSDLGMTPRRAGDTLQYTVALGAPESVLTITRSYKLSDDYCLAAGVNLTGPNSGYLMLFRNGSELTEPNKNEDLQHNTLLAQNQKFLRLGARQVKAQLNLGGKFTWAGMKTLYFLTALVPQNFQLDTLIGAGLVDRRLGWIAGVKGARSSDRYRVYFGPLAYSALRACNLHAAFDFGRFLVIDLKWIGLPILRFLQLVYRLVKNFGLAIIVFAIVMKAIFFPLSRIQNKQMKSMQLLQPKLDELKKRYKNDAEGLNRETMQLYKLYKVNPLAGCLPLLIQMPIFFAMYQVLRTSIDLRHAQFIFWIHDLSLKDHFYVLPILMGVFSILQSFLTSVGQQNKLLMFMMPVFITVIFLNFPSGLQLYWLMFNILSIIESLIVQGGMKWPKIFRRTQPTTP
jgi:YidC/Oxa1 family membrane protein insertase